MKCLPKITFTVSNKGAAWIKAQAKALGVDDSGIAVRMLVLWAERNGVELSVGTAAPKRDAELERREREAEAEGIRNLTAPYGSPWKPGWADENGKMPPDQLVIQHRDDSVDVDALVNSTLSEAESAGALEQAPASEGEEPPASITTPLVRRKGAHGGVGNLVALR